MNAKASKQDPQVANLLFGPEDSEMKPLKIENLTFKLSLFKALQMILKSNVRAIPSKGAVMLSNDGLTGTLNTRKTESTQSVTLTIFTFLSGTKRSRRIRSGIIVGRPEGSRLTRGIELFQEVSG
jgi:hypothetical protein